MVGRGNDATLRAALVAAMLIGVVVGRRVVGVPVLAHSDQEALVETFAPIVPQTLVG